jgi:hypothetical protein|nr:MAG TPA: major capsid protein [Caudoviricetes sp.]
MAMNLQQTRVVDPVLTNVAIGYTNAEFVGNFLFPRIFVPKEGGKVIKFDKEAFRLHNAKRAMSADRKRISFGYEGDPFVLDENSLEAAVDRRQLKETETLPGLDLASRAVNLTMNIILLGSENEKAQLARNADNYDSDHKTTLAGTAKWSNEASDPVDDITEAQKVIEESIGRTPNLLTLSNAAYRALKSHPAILEHFKYTSAKAVSVDMLRDLLDVEIIKVGRALYVDDAGKTQPVWGNDAILSYSDQNPSGMESPAFGYDYTLEGHPMVEEAYYDDHTTTYYYPVTLTHKPVLTGTAAGYLFKDVT